MMTAETLRYEIAGRLEDERDVLGKTHLSVRYEPGPRIVRAGVCIANYDWETRMRVLRLMLAFEKAHADEFAVEFDVVPLDPVMDDNFAEA